MKAVWWSLPAVLGFGAWYAYSTPDQGRVLVLEDFETAGAASRWEGPVEVSTEHSSHGRHSLKIRMEGGHTQFSSAKLASDWRGHDRLRFDIYSERAGVLTATLRVYDAVGGDMDQARKDDYADAANKILVQKGWTHVEVALDPLKAASYQRDIALDKIRRLLISCDRNSFPLTLWVDNFRVTAGEEGADTASRTEPQDAVSTIDNRWVASRQVARPEDVPESAEVKSLRAEAERETELLRKTIQAAQLQGIDTIYAERHLATAEIGLAVRPLLSWFNNNEKKREMFTFVARSCRDGRHEIEDLLRGTTPRAEVDDTQMEDASIRPYPHLKGRPVQGSFFRDERGDPMMILSLHSPSQELQRFFSTPLQHIESYSVGGGSRWTIDDSPVYKVWQNDPESHRVGWDGWCGHLVRDLSSMGGTKKENTVICLEDPRIQEAVREYIRVNIPRFYKNPELLYNIMGYELMYICYCDRSRTAFHTWLEKKHGSIAQANGLWHTSYGSFQEVVPPPVKNSAPLPGTNRAIWYEWARFNQDRFTDYLISVRNTIRQIDPSVPLAAGGSSSMLAGRTGTTGIDEERIVNEVDDVVIHEGGGSTLGMDLQLALAETRKPLADPEMGLGSVEYLLPHFLHGKSVAQLYHWPAQPANEFYSNNRSSLAHSWSYSLEDVNEVLRVAIDVRRLNKEIAAFAETPADVAILYSQTSTLQLPPEMLTWQTTPYLAELRKTYEASQYLDAKVTFVTERQVMKGWLDRYKLLLVPGVRNLPSGVVEAIWNYASNGGHVLIVPESLLGDEYNRQQDYLARLGISIRGTRRPKASGGGRMVQGYDQSFSQDVVFTSDAPEKLKNVGAGSIGDLEARGVRQTLSGVGNAGILFRYSDESPAIVSMPLGKGVVVYSACSLEERSYARLLEELFGQASVRRPLRLRAAAGSDTWKIESRFARAGSRRLFYVVNFNPEPKALRIDAGSEPFEFLRELRDNKAIRGNQVTVPGRQTGIYELFQKTP